MTAYTARKNEILDADGKQIAIVMPSNCSKKEACGMAEIIAIYEKLHANKLGAHWLWVVIEQIAAGVPEDEAFKSFDYYETSPWRAPVLPTKE